MNDGDNHEDETASMHLVFLPLDTLTLPFQIYVHLTPMIMLQVFPPSMPVDKGIYLIPRKQLCVRLNKYGHMHTCTLAFLVHLHLVREVTLNVGRVFHRLDPFPVWSRWVYMVVYERCPVIAFSRRSFDLSGPVSLVRLFCL